MKNKLHYLFILVLLASSCKTSNIIKVVNSQAKEELYGKINKVIEKRYSDFTNKKSLTNERHIFIKNNKQIDRILEYRVFKNLETGILDLQKMGEIRYNYKRKKLIEIIEISSDEKNKSINQNNSNIIRYSYLDDNASNYEAFRHNNLDHKGTIVITNDYEMKETISYPNDDLKPVTYYKIFNKAFQLTKYTREYYYNNELKTENKSYSYLNNNISSVSTAQYKISYEYKFDNRGNWINRIGKINGKIVELLKREISYK